MRDEHKQDPLEAAIKKHAGCTRPAEPDAAFLARLKTIPARHPQTFAKARPLLQTHGLRLLFRPILVSIQGGVLASALVAGLYVGMAQPVPIPVSAEEPEEVDLSDILFPTDFLEETL